MLKKAIKHAMMTDMSNTEHDRPIFIFGSGRSGTTLLQRILNTHKDVVLSGEHGGFLNGLAVVYQSFHHEGTEMQLAKDEQIFETPEELVAYVKNPENWSAWANIMHRDELDERLRTFIKSFFVTNMTPRWGFKEIRYGHTPGVLRMLAALFPEARFVVLVRNPIDVILSQISMFRQDPSVYTMLAKRWANLYSNFLAFKKEYPAQVYIYQYEQLCKAKDFTDVQAFLDLSGDIAIQHVLNLEHGRGDDEKRNDRASLLQPKQIQEIKDEVADVAQQVGYIL